MKFIDRYGHIILGQDFENIGIYEREYDKYITIVAYSKYSKEEYYLAMFEYNSNNEKFLYRIAQCGAVLICYADSFVRDREFFKVNLENIMKAFKYNLHGNLPEDCIEDFYNYLSMSIDFDNNKEDEVFNEIYKVLFARDLGF